MIFPILKYEDVIYTNNRVRFEASESFANKALATVSHEMSMDGGSTWINITQKKHLDWMFLNDATYVVQLRINTSDLDSATISKTVEVVDASTQVFFSNDSDLYKYEADIDKYLPDRWSSWIHMHAEARKIFMDWLDEKGIKKEDGSKYLVEDVMDIEQVRQFSTFKALELIFESNIKVTGDVFSFKRDHYRKLSNEKLSRSEIKLDFNGNTEADESTNLLTVGVERS